MASVKYNDYSNSPTLLLPPQSIHSINSSSYQFGIHYNPSYPSAMKYSLTHWSLASVESPSLKRKRNYDETLDETSGTLLETLSDVRQFDMSYMTPKVDNCSRSSSFEDRRDLISETVSQELALGSHPGTWPQGSVFALTPGGRPFYMKSKLDASSRPRSSGDRKKPTARLKDLSDSPDKPIEMCHHEGFDLEDQSTGVALLAKTWTEIGLSTEPSRKARRLDTSSIQGWMADGWKNAPASHKLYSTGPAIDRFTILLGVGWSSVGQDPDVQAAARGCAKYVENHYPLSTARILLKSKALDASLVETDQGYYLFSDDLSQGRLVGVSWEICLSNLRSSPVTYEGSEPLQPSARNPPSVPCGSAQGASAQSTWAPEAHPALPSSSPPTSPDFDEMLVD